MAKELPIIDGPLIMRRRTELMLSRDRFARLIDVRPGAVWRFEVKNTIRPDEVAHLQAIADRWLTCDGLTALNNLAAAETRSTAKSQVRPAPASAVRQQRDDGVDDADADLIQWADALPPDGVRQLRVVYGDVAKTSPTMLTASDGLLRVSNSEVNTFKRCRRKWWLVYLRGLREVHEQPFGARATGTRLHAALAAWYRPTSEERVDPRDALEIIIAHERAQLEAAGTSLEELKKFNADAELERVVIAGYLDWLKETGADTDYTVIGSEQYLEASLPDVENTRIIARLDARVRRQYDNARLFIDHKSVASISQAVRLLTLNTQMMWYMLLEQLQPDLDPTQRVGGALYNMMRRCKRTAAAKPPFYERVEVHYNPHEIAAFRQWLVGTLDDMAFCRQQLANGESHHAVVYPTPTRDCTWDCPFLKVCSMANDGSRFEDALAEHYTVGDPYGYYKTPLERGEHGD